MADPEKLDELPDEDKVQEQDEPQPHDGGDEPTKDEPSRALQREPSKRDAAFLVDFEDNDPSNPMKRE